MMWVTTSTTMPRAAMLVATAKKMAKLSAAQILEFIKTCGLAPTKAKNVKGLSEILVEKHGGEVPRSFAELEGLFLDPTYTGKAAHALVEEVRARRWGGRILFWHTGGTPALFAYADELLGEVCA